MIEVRAGRRASAGAHATQELRAYRRYHEQQLIADYIINTSGMNPGSLLASARLYRGYSFTMKVSLSIAIGGIRDVVRAKELAWECKRVYGVRFHSRQQTTGQEAVYMLSLAEEYTSNDQRNCEDALNEAIGRLNGALETVGIKGASLSLSVI